MCTRISQTADRIQDVGVDGNAVRILAVIELNELNQTVEANNLNQNPDRTIARLDIRFVSDLFGIFVIEYKTKIKIFIYQLTSKY